LIPRRYYIYPKHDKAFMFGETTVELYLEAGTGPLSEVI